MVFCVFSPICGEARFFPFFKQHFSIGCDTNGEGRALRNYYEILQVSRDAGPEVIAAARRAIFSSMKKHPDLGGDSAEAALINEAYEVLTDPARRSAYDAKLASCAGAGVEKSGGERFEERRRAPRREINTTVSFCLDFDLCWHSARVRDVSVLGVRIQTHAQLVTGQHLVIAPTNLASQAIHGTVKWTRMFHPSVFERVYEAGIEFSDQIPDVEGRLEV